MEFNGNDKVVVILKELIDLTTNNDQTKWANILKNILHHYLYDESKTYAATLAIDIMQGGMGSFLDLVLHKNKKVLIAENNKLDKLRYDLFNECKKIVK